MAALYHRKHNRVSPDGVLAKDKSALPGTGTYAIPVAPQQIVTVHFETAETLPAPDPVTAWDEFVPEHKRAALHAYDPNVKGHPPFGGGSMEF